MPALAAGLARRGTLRGRGPRLTEDVATNRLSRVPPRIDGRRLSHETSAAIRRLAVERVARGERPSAVIARYGMCRTTIYRWLRAARRGGLGALAPRRHPGRPPRVTDGQAARVRARLLDRTPADHGLPGALWTRRTVAELVRRHTGTAIGPIAAGRLLRRLALDRRCEPALLPEAASRGGAYVLLAADGRGSFLCRRLEDPPTPANVRRAADDLQRAAGRPVRPYVLADAFRGAPAAGRA
jgi:transposase